MHSQDNASDGRVARRVAVALCAAVLAAGVLGRLAPGQPVGMPALAPDHVAAVAALLAIAGILPTTRLLQWPRTRQVLQWSGFLLMVWAANGLPFDVLRLAGAIPLPVDWPGFATRTLALAALVALGRLVLVRPDGPPRSPATWYGYAGFVFALPYPILRTAWAMGSTIGLGWRGAGGHGWAPWLLAIPWLLAATLSLLLVPTWRWMPRRLLVAAGWFATTVVAMIGPGACWAFVSAVTTRRGPQFSGIAVWVFGLFYGSWLLWAIAAGAATRSYQLRTAFEAQPHPSPASPNPES